MPITTANWNEASPAGGDQLNTADDRIRETREQIRDRLANEANHLDIDANPTLAALHIASTSQAIDGITANEFRIFDSTGSTVRFAALEGGGFRYGPGTTNFDVVERRVFNRGVTAGTTVTVATIQTQSNTAYGFEVMQLATNQSGGSRSEIVKVMAGVNRGSGAGVLFISSPTTIMSNIFGATVIDPSVIVLPSGAGGNILIQAKNDGTSTANFCTIYKYWSVDEAA